RRRLGRLELEQPGLGLQALGGHDVVEAAQLLQPVAHDRAGEIGALALLAHDQALLDQEVDRLAHGDPADPEPAHQVVLAGQPPARRMATGRDLLAQEIGDLGVQRAVAVAPERRGAALPGRHPQGAFSSGLAVSMIAPQSSSPWPAATPCSYQSSTARPQAIGVPRRSSISTIRRMSLCASLSLNMGLRSPLRSLPFSVWRSCQESAEV